MKPQSHDNEFARFGLKNGDAESQRLWCALRELPNFAQMKSERPDHFWTKQRAQIWENIEAKSSKRARRTLGLAWAAASAMIALAAMLLAFAPVPEMPQAQVDPDHQLLLDIERSLNTGGPQALEPATLLVEEISQNSQSNPASSGDIKETLR
jgi:hypothetical protein